MLNCTVGRREELENLSSGLDRCQKSLIDYLNRKRLVFPRFNFISDEELLGILGSSDPSGIQQHIGKMFDNLDKFRLGPDHDDKIVASALISTEGEIMEFETAVQTNESIEKWMVKALAEMQRTNRLITKKAVYDYCRVSVEQT